MCLTCGCDEPGRPRRAIARRNSNRPDPDELVIEATEDALARAATWIGWDSGAVMSLGNAWTPHKALRRITDHLIDHLCQIEARAADEAPVPDLWRGRSVTLDSDWARFTEQDLDEASARIRRLAQVMALRLRALSADWDAEVPDQWTLRAIAEHLADASGAYASRPTATATALPPTAGN
jgi:hypothetical protein